MYAPHILFCFAFQLASMMDALDRAILQALRADARLSFRALARATQTTTPTAAARVRRMEDAGVIRGYTVILDDGLVAVGEALPATLDVACHHCGRRTGDPEWWRGDGRHHPFCCSTCKAAFVARHEELLDAAASAGPRT